jgi:hydroxyacylglutathione hydrolase
MTHPDLILHQMEVGPMQNFVYLIGSKKTGEVAVVDPAWEVDRILEQAASMDVKVKYAFVTHTHFDHINGLSDMLDKTDAKVYVHKTETANTKIPDSQIVPTDHGHELEIGDVKIRFLHTPGHTCGSQCFEISGNLVAGDTLFVHNCGRTDLPTGNREEMFSSLKFLSELPANTILFPGHDYGPTPTSTIEEEKEQNPYMRIENLDEFLKSGMV